MKIAAIVLAAGESSRLGRPKQDVVLAGETLLHRSLRVAFAAGLAPVIAVVREARYIDGLQRHGAMVLLNRKAHEGMASSIQCGIAAAKSFGVDGAVIMTCDQPGLQPEHLRALIGNAGVVCGSAYSGRVGVPAYFPETFFGALSQLQGDAGARDLLRGAESVPQQLLSVDIDTEEDFRTAQILFER